MIQYSEGDDEKDEDNVISCFQNLFGNINQTIFISPESKFGQSNIFWMLNGEGEKEKEDEGEGEGEDEDEDEVISIWLLFITPRGTVSMQYLQKYINPFLHISFILFPKSVIDTTSFSKRISVL